MTKKNVIKRGQAASQVCDALRREILTMELKPGEPLDETRLSERFNVSRSPVREALNRLLAERLVQTLPNKTTIVAQVDLFHFPKFIEALDLQQRYATRLAAKNRTEEDLETIRALSGDYQSNVEQFQPLEILQSNFEFHYAIGEAGKNPYVTRQYGELLSDARRLLHIHIDYLLASHKESLLEDQHDDFCDAIEAQDIELADEVAHSHTMQFHDRFLAAQQYYVDDAFEFLPENTNKVTK